MGIFRFKFNRSTTIWILTCLGLFLTTSCGVDALSYGSLPASPPTPQPICSVGENFYTATDGAIGLQSEKAKNLANEIYNKYVVNPNDLELARSQAIDFLAYEAMRWSHIEDIKLDDNNSVRVLVTFMSPELIRAVLLNHALFSLAQSPLSGTNLTDFSNKTLSVMDGQKKYLFLSALQPMTMDQSTMPFQIPSSRVVLINDSGMHVNVINSDNFLDQTFDFSSPPHAGFLFYPFGSMNSGICQRVLDPSRDTSITLSMDAKFGTETRAITWEILFAPPLQVSSPLPTPNPGVILPDGDKTPLKDVPALTQFPDIAYWRAWGRFVWGKMTYDHFSLP